LLPQQAPQSSTQVWQVSPYCGSQTAFPQQGPQSWGHEAQLSVGPQDPLPQTSGQVPQSAAQVAQLSVTPQVPSPQTSGHVPQSRGHEAQVSCGLQTPLPQLGQ
jgi:hypothetical protein